VLVAVVEVVDVGLVVVDGLLTIRRPIVST